MYKRKYEERPDGIQNRTFCPINLGLGGGVTHDQFPPIKEILPDTKLTIKEIYPD